MNKAAETAKIPCAVCRDLMPLVQDGVASPESEALVQAHMAVCPAWLAHAGIPAGQNGPCVWAVLTCRDTGMGKPLLLFTLGLAVLDAIIKQTAFLESFSLSNFLWNLASGCILYAVLGGMGWLIGWLLHYSKESTHENKE